MDALQKTQYNELELIRDITFNQVKAITFAHARTQWR